MANTHSGDPGSEPATSWRNYSRDAHDEDYNQGAGDEYHQNWEQQDYDTYPQSGKITNGLPATQFTKVLNMMTSVSALAEINTIIQHN